MKKLIYNQFGGVSNLILAEVPVPEPDASGILIRVKAVSINPLDWKIREGEMKLMSGSKFPKSVGIDFSGIVEKTGGSVTAFKKGDEVFGAMNAFKGGALAEYILVTEKDIVKKPVRISFEKAAVLGVTGSAALQLLDQLVTLTPGTEVLINGATGGIGMFTIQLSKRQGAIVTAVAGPKGTELAKKWGSDFIIDYQQTDILSAAKKYDVMIDLSGKIPFSKAKHIMKPVSVYINAVPGPQQIIGSFFHNLFSKQKYKVLLYKLNLSYLHQLGTYAEDGMDILISATYPMTAFKQAFTEVSTNSVQGKAVFTVG